MDKRTVSFTLNGDEMLVLIHIKNRLGCIHHPPDHQPDQKQLDGDRPQRIPGHAIKIIEQCIHLAATFRGPVARNRSGGYGILLSVSLLGLSNNKASSMSDIIICVSSRIARWCRRLTSLEVSPGCCQLQPLRTRPRTKATPTVKSRKFQAPRRPFLSFAAVTLLIISPFSTDTGLLRFRATNGPNQTTGLYWDGAKPAPP